MTVGERIRTAREQAGLTQEDLGQKIGVTGVAVMRYEKGKRQPRLEQLEAIAKALNVPIANLLIGPPPLYEGGDVEPLQADVQRVAISMERMNDEGREKVVDYAEDLEASGRYKKHGSSGMGKEA